LPLKVSAGQYSDAGRKPANQDFHGLCVPHEPHLGSKGVAIALADGISSSEAALMASQAAVTTFLGDYYCTSDAWSVRKSAERVLAAINSWLYAQTQQGLGRFDKDRGWACTFSALVLKSRTAHLFHVGDTRVYQVQGQALEQLTQDHRVAIGGGQSYLGRAFGIGSRVDIDYQAVALEEGDTFVLATDGVYEHLREREMLAMLALHREDLDAAARAIAQLALQAGSPDNVTVQVLRVDALPEPEAGELSRRAAELPAPPILGPRMEFDGYRIVRELHGSSRSHIYLALDLESHATVVLKTPSIDRQADPAYVERFLLEEWVARRVDSAHVLKASPATRRRNFLYVVMEYVEGRTLAQWMLDHPRPDLDTVRGIVEQVGRGLRALHRLEMVHLDLRPENIMIDATGTARIIDFGATQVAGIAEMDDAHARQSGLGMAQYMAPECLLGARATPACDQFSLAVVAYQMLSGRLPYGAQVAQSRTLADHKRLRYQAVGDVRRDIPGWVDGALHKALQPQAARRYADVSEFVFALHQPDPDVAARRRPPLIERDPVLFWKGVSLLLALGCVFLAALRAWGR
jgi:serine/threonine protein phosphatase PrpC